MHVNARRLIAAAPLALMLVLVLAVPAFATSHDVPILDFSADVAPALATVLAGIVATIGAVFGIALAVRLTRKGANWALKLINMIRP